VTKEEREAGTKGAIIGNFKIIGGKPAAKPSAPARAQQRQADPDLDAPDECPF
jgi:hypothetical protein